MSNHIDGSRNSCALHGALQLIEAIEGAVPVIHSNAGCGYQHFLGVNRLNAGGDAFGGPPVSSSNISEKHVVFGGSSRLREQLKNTIQVVEGDLYFIVSGCSTEMVGDDIPAMTKEGRDQNFPVIYANTPGFRGDVHHGYQLAVKALVEQLPDLLKAGRTRTAGQVNLWGVIPHQDPFWAGNLEEIGRLLEGIGLKPNLLLGYGQDVNGWHKVPDADLNIAVSIWGETPAKLLEERYGTPALTLEGLPVGAAAGRMLLAVSEKLGIDRERTESFVRSEENRLNRHLAALADTYYRAGFQLEFALVGESAQVVGLSEFLTSTLGLIPRTLVITDNPSEEAKATLQSLLAALVEGWGTELSFSEDHIEISGLIRSGGAGLVLGSALEEQVAVELGLPFLQVSFPLSGRVVINRGYAGYKGASSLLEDLGSVILSHALRADISSQDKHSRSGTVFYT
ncbi:MAG TPA: nitrogenase component 1 [Chlorobaculum sp.]|nr:nitrogenase component 1 [Chlorobaculum sp.]